jgi:hypothetical protein
MLTLLLCEGAVAAPRAQENPPQTQQQPATPPENQNEPTPPPGNIPPPAHVRAQFFAGTVTKVDEKQVVVSRRLVGKAPESRTFLIQDKTKVSRTLKPKQRVTVRYQHLPEGDVALEIQVRQPRSARSTS